MILCLKLLEISIGAHNKAPNVTVMAAEESLTLLKIKKENKAVKVIFTAL